MGKNIFRTAISANPNNIEVKQFQKGNAVRLIWAYRKLSEYFGIRKDCAKSINRGKLLRVIKKAARSRNGQNQEWISVNV